MNITKKAIDRALKIDYNSKCAAACGGEGCVRQGRLNAHTKNDRRKKNDYERIAFDL